MLDIVQVTKYKRFIRIEANGNNVLGIFVRQPLISTNKCAEISRGRGEDEETERSSR